VIDAMGHGLRASLLGTLAVTALRNARRTGLALTDQLRQADRVLHSQFGGEQFVTALALRIDTATGAAEVVNAGHPLPYIIRNGVITSLEVAPDVPLGMFESTQYVEQSAQLLPGDRLVLVSDGLVEATNPLGEEYGEARLQGALLATAALPTGEAVRHMVRTIRDYQDDELRDDATVLCLDWRRNAGPGGEDRAGS
jgi:serine phosphatase RsbU (regulator of sigma subunit)